MSRSISPSRSARSTAIALSCATTAPATLLPAEGLSTRFRRGAAAVCRHGSPFSKQLPKPIRGWTLTTLREKLIKIGAKVVAHAKYVTFQLAEVAVPRQLFAQILERIARLCPAWASG